MPIIESVLTSGNVDRRLDNLLRAFRKPSVLRIPTTSCPVYENDAHWLDNGVIIQYPELFEGVVSADTAIISAFATARGFADLTPLNNGTYGIGFYQVEQPVLNIVSAITFINNDVLNFCVNASASIEYENRIVFTKYEVKPGLISQLLQLIEDLKARITAFQLTSAYADLSPNQQQVFDFIGNDLLDSNNALTYNQIPPFIANLSGWTITDPNDFYVTSTPIVSANIFPFEYVEIRASAVPPMRQLLSDEVIWRCSDVSAGYAVTGIEGTVQTNATIQYYGCQIEEVTGGAMPGTVKGLKGHTTDLIAGLLGILSAISARNGLLDYLSTLGGICGAFAQAIGTVLGLIQAVMAAIAAVIGTILALIDTITQVLAEIVELIVNQIAALIGQAMALMREIFSKIMDEIKKIVQFFQDLIDQALASIFGELDDCLKALIEQVAVPAAVGAISKNVDIGRMGIF